MLLKSAVKVTDHTKICFNLFLIFCPSLPSFVFVVLLECSFTVLSGYFIFHSIRWPFSMSKFGLNP